MKKLMIAAALVLTVACAKNDSDAGAAADSAAMMSDTASTMTDTTTRMMDSTARMADSAMVRDTATRM